MKITVSKDSFIKSWNIAERNASTGSMNALSSVHLTAGTEGAELQATDMRTSVICRAGGVSVLEPGEAVIPIKGVSDLFKKAGAPEFTITVDDGRAVMVSGRSRYKFTTYPSGDFPKLPSSENGEFFCSITAEALGPALERGTLCASVGDEYPQYLSSALFEMQNGTLNIVSTDNKRLALNRTEVIEGSESEPMLLPLKGIKELQRVLGTLEPSAEIRISSDDAQAFFVTDGLEFAVRRVETKFPSYQRILPVSHETRVDMDKSDLMAALERVDVVVRDYNRVVMVNASGTGECVLTGRAREFGEAVENVACEMEGEPIVMGVNSRFFFDAVKALEEDSASLLFNGGGGHMTVRSKNKDNFLSLVAPIELTPGDLERETGGESGNEGDGEARASSSAASSGDSPAEDAGESFREADAF